MRRFLSACLILGCLAIISPAEAAVKSGATCSKKNTSQVISGKKFTCILKGKKLVWSSGISLAKPLPSPTPSATSTKISEPVVDTPVTPTSFENLVANYKGIHLAVWRDVRNRLLNKGDSTKFEVLTGPKSTQPVSKPNTERLLLNASTIFADYSQPKVTKVYYFNSADVPWAQSEHGKLVNPKFRQSEIADNCKNEWNCGAFGSASQGVGAMFMGIHLQGLDPLEIYGGTEIHEFTHVVQYSLYSEAVALNPGRHLPGWFLEGQASAIQQAGGTKDYSEYLSSRKKWFNHSPKGSVTNYSPESILNLFELQGPGKFDQETWSHVYDIGSFAVEAMIAVGGVGSTMDLIKEVSAGNSFESAFLKIYKVSWSEAKIQIANAVSREFSDARG